MNLRKIFKRKKAKITTEETKTVLFEGASSERKALETELLTLYMQITSYEDGRFQNMSFGDEEGYALLREVYPVYEKLVEKYVKMVHDLQDEGGFGTDYPLPPFVVFPTYTPSTIGWRMGAGESYEKSWWKSIEQMMEEEFVKYCSKYDYPEWWKDWCNQQGWIDIPCRYVDLPWRNNEW